MKIWLLYLLLLRATLLSFSGFGSVPVLRDSLVVQHGVLTDSRLNNAIAISQASPGPLGLYVVIVGYFVAGLAGALAGALALASPALLAIPIARLVLRGRSPEIRGAAGGIVIAACALMATAALSLAPSALPTPRFLVLAAVAFGLLTLSSIRPVWIILGSACCAVLLGR